MLRVADDYAPLTHPGKLRRVNEDSYLARSPLFVIADGMGGAQAGEVASATAIEVFQDGLPDGPGSAEERMARMVEEANRRVHERSLGDRDLQGMGTTTTAVYVGDPDVSIAHVGDSRAYLLRAGTFERLTEDHTLVEEFVRQGKLTQEEAEEHPQRSIITRALGPEEQVAVDTLSIRGRDGDVFLVCSDGLTSMVPEARVGEILQQAATLSAAASALVQAANDAGGRDNITVLLFRLEEVGVGSTADEHTMVGAAAPSTAEVKAAVESAPPRPERTSTVPRQPRPPRAEVAPAKRRRFRGLRRTLIVLAIVLVPLGGGAYLASQAVYFLGVASDGSVAVFQGVPFDLPFGIRLYSSAYVTGLTAQQLPPALRKRLLDHKLRSHDDAFDLARKLELGQVGPTG
jgi:serine/threonine protein phosphatase PrpC